MAAYDQNDFSCLVLNHLPLPNLNRIFPRRFDLKDCSLLAGEPAANLFHSSPVHAQIAITHPRGRAELDSPGVVVEYELHVVHESPQRARELRPPVIGLAPHHPGALPAGNGSLEPLARLRRLAAVGERLDVMLLVARRRLARHAVGLVRARREPPLHNPEANAAIATSNGCNFSFKLSQVFLPWLSFIRCKALH